MKSDLWKREGGIADLLRNHANMCPCWAQNTRWGEAEAEDTKVMAPIAPDFNGKTQSVIPSRHAPGGQGTATPEMTAGRGHRTPRCGLLQIIQPAQREREGSRGSNLGCLALGPEIFTRTSSLKSLNSSFSLLAETEATSHLRLKSTCDTISHPTTAAPTKRNFTSITYKRIL